MAFSTEKNKTQYTPPIPDYSSFSANALDFNNSVSPQSSPSTFKFEPLNLTGLGEDWLTKNWASNPTSQTPGAYDFSKAQLGNYNPMASMAPMASQNSVNPVNPNNSGFWSNPLTTTNIDKNGVVTENQGFLGPVFDGLGAVSNIYFGMKGLDLA
ncbi:MAG: hypothetical protein GY829_15740, partial [Gammaproteobacteria bacterium]|nr:hypothetical protein [Gammaproteobacteria bacterium]